MVPRIPEMLEAATGAEPALLAAELSVGLELGAAAGDDWALELVSGRPPPTPDPGGASPGS
jgi:hypothetical protein